MPSPLREVGQWPPEADEAIKRLRGEGLPWEEVAHRVGASRAQTYFHGVRELGLPAKIPKRRGRPPIDWPPEKDAKLVELRSKKTSWTEIALALRVPIWAAIKRGRVIGAVRGDPSKKAAPRHVPIRTTEGTAPSGRLPLPSGHPDTWGSITEGTSLEGLPYPLEERPR